MAAVFSHQSQTTTTPPTTAWVEMQEPSIDTDKLSYEIFSILESKFLFGYDDEKNIWIPKSLNGQAASMVDADAAAVAAAKRQRGKICILSIDGGGGMRGILAGKALAYLEQSLRAKSGNPKAKIADYFDVAAGTGVGGIFTAMLFGTKDRNRAISDADGTWRLLAEQGKRLYDRQGSKKGGLLKKVFKSNSTGGSPGLGRAVREMFGELTLKDTLKPVLIPCYDMLSSAPFLFSRADALETNGFDFRLWEVCCATAAEPAIFEPVSMRSVDGQTQCLAVDGCLAMSNPTAAAITHVLHNKQEFPFVGGVEDLLVLSLGTGQILEINYDYEQIKGWKAKQWARPMVRITGDGSAEAVDQAVAMAFSHSSSNSYVRIQANGSSLCRRGARADTDPRSDNVKALVEMADEMLNQKNVESVLFGGKRIGEQSNAEKLEWFAGELVLERQRRSCGTDPTVAFKQAA